MEMALTLTVKKLKTIVSLKLNLFSKFHLSKQTFYLMRSSTKLLQQQVQLKTQRSNKQLRTFWSIWTTNTRRRSKKTHHNLIIQEPVCKVNNRCPIRKLKIMVRIGPIDTRLTNLKMNRRKLMNPMVRLIWMRFNFKSKEKTNFFKMRKLNNQYR